MDVHLLEVSVGPLRPTFHPHLALSLHPQRNAKRDDAQSCRIHISLTLPDSLFVDPDELAGSWTSTLSGVISYDLHPRVIDIERPYRVAEADQTPIRLDVVLLSDAISLNVPLHGRYLPPDETGYRQITVIGGNETVTADAGQLRAAQVCSVVDTTRLATAELPIVTLKAPVILVLPTGKHSHQSVTEIVTAMAIWLGWFYLVWKIWRLVKRVDKQRPVSGKKED